MAKLTLQAALECAAEIKQDGDHETPNVKLALAAAILSANNRLDRNGWQVNALRKYMMTHDGCLPTTVETIKRITRDAGFEAAVNHCDYLIDLERRARLGELIELGHKPTSALEWLLWRQAATTIRGLGWKTASFAALLCWPLDCPLVPCDRHVVGRLAFAGKLSHLGQTGEQVYKALGGSTDRAYRTYRAVERLVGNEKLLAGATVSTAVWHWYKWSEWRQFNRLETADGACESHRLLSPYWY